MIYIIFDIARHAIYTHSGLDQYFGEYDLGVANNCFSNASIVSFGKDLVLNLRLRIIY